MKQSFLISDPKRFAAAIQRFDEENSQDPNKVTHNGVQRPREVIYAEWLSDWVLRLNPDASEALQLAARSAHLQRWSIPREEYSPDRPGYLRWRADLKKFHARKVGDILHEIGYPQETIDEVQALVSKSAFPKNPDARLLEDALCLVFLEHQFADLAAKSTEDKMINAVQKTWQKMTPTAHAIAVKLNYTPKERALMEKALIQESSAGKDPDE